MSTDYMLPHAVGWPNPPGNLSYILVEPNGSNTVIELSWYPPTYTGGLNEWALSYWLWVEVAELELCQPLGNNTLVNLELPLALDFHFNVAIGSTDCQLISEKSPTLTVSGVFCEEYCKQLQLAK